MPSSPKVPAIYVDRARCIGCNACSLACKQENIGCEAIDINLEYINIAKQKLAPGYVMSRIK